MATTANSTIVESKSRESKVKVKSLSVKSRKSRVNVESRHLLSTLDYIHFTVNDFVFIANKVSDVSRLP